MGQQIVKQPNGKYCLFSSVVDSVIDYNMNEEEIIEKWTTVARLEYTRKVKEIIKQLEKGEKPYHQFTLSFGDVLETIKKAYGYDEATNVRATIENEG